MSGHRDDAGVWRPRPKAMEFDVGNDVYGRPVTLALARDTGGKEAWSLRTLPANQRDEGERMGGLSIANLRAIGEIARGGGAL